MPKTTAPLFGFSAAGQLGKSIVFADWKGRGYARRYVIPSNPNTAGQQATRSTFSFLNSIYKFGSAAFVASWDAFAAGKVLTGRNGFLKANVSDLIGQPNLNSLLFSNGALGGFAPASVSAAPGVTQIVVTVTAPSIPADWSIQAAWAVAVKDQDPQTGASFVMSEATDAAAPYTPTITGLTTGVLYQVGAWFTFIRPDGQIAYGPSLNDTETPT